MKPVTLAVVNVGVSSPIVTDYLISPFNIGFGVVVNGTGVTYTVQHTFNDPFVSTFTPASATWFPHEDLVNATTSQDGNYAFPVRAIRLNVTAADSGAGATITLVQAGAV